MSERCCDRHHYTCAIGEEGVPPMRCCYDCPCYPDHPEWVFPETEGEPMTTPADERRKGIVNGLVSAHSIVGHVHGRLVDALIADGMLQQELHIDGETARLLLTMLIDPVVASLLASARELDADETDRSIERAQDFQLSEAIEPYMQQVRVALREVRL